jgi:hypothetical protein
MEIRKCLFGKIAPVAGVSLEFGNSNYAQDFTPRESSWVSKVSVGIGIASRKVARTASMRLNMKLHSDKDTSRGVRVEHMQQLLERLSLDEQRQPVEQPFVNRLEDGASDAAIRQVMLWRQTPRVASRA